MKSSINFVAGFAVCAALFTAMGAMQAGDSYQRACIAVQAEGVLGIHLAKDPKRYEANKRRFEYWVSVMEQFKP